MAVSYFGIFVYLLFPPVVVLLALLLLPLPGKVHRAVVHLCDTILFLEPHPDIKLSLFWLILLLAGTTFIVQLNTMNDYKKVYKRVKESGGEKEDALIDLLASERNVWISGAAFCGWLILHRYRSLLKKYYRLEDTTNKKVN